jgi:hypothetical protein
MKRLIFGLYSIPALLAIGASLLLMEGSIVLLCALLACGLVVVMACPLFGFARWRGERLWPVLAGAILCLPLIASVAIWHWPLRVAWLLSRSGLERLAEDVRAGRPLPRRTRVGLFTIVEAEARQGIICLWVDPDPGGKLGFVQCPPGRLPGNLWSMVRMDENWLFIQED